MYANEVEAVHYPRNPLDVLAQQIVAMVSMDDWDMRELYRAIRRAAPYAALTQSVFESVLDMLSGRYPSDEFVELRPRITWDRVAQRLTARQGARHTAVVNGGKRSRARGFPVFLGGGRGRPGLGVLGANLGLVRRSAWTHRVVAAKF